MGSNGSVVGFQVPTDIFPLFQYSNIPCEMAEMSCHGRDLIPKIIAIEV